MIMSITLLYIVMEASVILYFREEAKVESNLSKFEKPMFPYFFVVLSMSSGAYEGVTILPNIYAHARHKEQANIMVSYAATTLMLILLLLTPICLLAYGDLIQEIVLLNLQPEGFQQGIIFLYSLTIVLGGAINMLPILDIMSNFQFFRGTEP